MQRIWTPSSMASDLADPYFPMAAEASQQDIGGIRKKDNVVVIYLDFANPLIQSTLREISGTYWLTWVRMAIGSRRPQIISSIDPTVANFQVNDPDLCEIRGDENHNLPFSLLLKLLYYTVKKCRFESPLWHCFFMKFVLFSIHITLLWEDIYAPCWPCMFCMY